MSHYDHDTIEGCLQISDRPRTFISEQVTTYFPTIHASAYSRLGISENSIARSMKYAVIFLSCNATCRLADRARGRHPLYSITATRFRHLELLILLFNFRGINGLRDAF